MGLSCALLVAIGLVGCNDDVDGDGVADVDDCAPDDPEIHRGAWEVCDGVDNDCDGAVDELYDLDGDGFLADDAGCRALGEVTDCDDLDPAIHPAAEERPDGIDNDCDGVTDDSLDADGDGFGLFFDCDDTDPFVHPGAADGCDGIDNDCDGLIDPSWDLDGDGSSGCADDCDDTDPALAPHLPEVCDGQDNDCDGLVDEGFDNDGDGVAVCRGDCDDNNASISPGLQELCGDGIDNDCDPTTSETEDLDSDGFTFCSGDCDDNTGVINPGAAEVCDGLDNDCNGFVDELLACWSCDPAGTASYLFCTDQISQQGARNTCMGLGGDLVVMDDATENTLVSELAWSVQPGTYWIGLSDSEKEDEWRWVDGSLATYLEWGAGEPNNSGNEDCVHTNFATIRGEWNDLSCDLVQPFICEL